jgi:hypothetical protein
MAGEREPGSVEAIRKIQLSDGPTARFGTVLIVAILALAAIAWSAGDAIRFFCVLGVIGLVVYSIARAFRHARENPVKAALYGAEITQYQQCIGTKSDPRMLTSELIADVVRGPEDKTAAPPSPGQPPAAPAPTHLTLDLPSAPATESPTESKP